MTQQEKRVEEWIAEKKSQRPLHHLFPQPERAQVLWSRGQTVAIEGLALNLPLRLDDRSARIRTQTDHWTLQSGQSGRGVVPGSEQVLAASPGSCETLLVGYVGQERRRLSTSWRAGHTHRPDDCQGVPGQRTPFLVLRPQILVLKGQSPRSCPIPKLSVRVFPPPHQGDLSTPSPRSHLCPSLPHVLRLSAPTWELLSTCRNRTPFPTWAVDRALQGDKAGKGDCCSTGSP